MTLEEIGALGGLIFLFLFILVLIFLVLYFSRKKVIYQGTHDHIALYFDENIDSIIEEYDMATKNSLTKWKQDAYQRLETISKTTKTIQKKREKIDQRLSALEEEIANLR